MKQYFKVHLLIPADLSGQNHKPVVFCMGTGLSICTFYQQQAREKETKAKTYKIKDFLGSF